MDGTQPAAASAVLFGGELGKAEAGQTSGTAVGWLPLRGFVEHGNQEALTRCHRQLCAREICASCRASQSFRVGLEEKSSVLLGSCYPSFIYQEGHLGEDRVTPSSASVSSSPHKILILFGRLLLPAAAKFDVTNPGWGIQRTSSSTSAVIESDKRSSALPGTFRCPVQIQVWPRLGVLDRAARDLKLPPKCACAVSSL